MTLLEPPATPAAAHLRQIPWVEKYCPRTIADAILPARLKNMFQSFVNQRTMPNLMLCGTPGVGKTSVAKATCNEIDAECYVINASSDRGIEMVRGDIAGFASTVNMFHPGERKYLVLDEADNLTPEAQNALRGVMDRAVGNCTFILIANDRRKVILALRSRCQVLDFDIEFAEENAPMKAQQAARACVILDEEGIDYDLPVVENIVGKHYPDFRGTLNELQALAALGKIAPTLPMNGRLCECAIEDMNDNDDVDMFGGDDAPDRKAPPGAWLVPVATAPSGSSEGARLFDDIKSAIEKYVVLPVGAPEAVALFVLHAHAHDAAQFSPILAVVSPEIRCGKTTMLGVLGALTPRPLPTSNITPAALYRIVGQHSPTLLIDEGETFLLRNAELRGIVNSGHNRSGAVITRTDGIFRTWSPKVIALIGSPPDTLADRSIFIRLQRKLRTDVTERLDVEGIASLDDLRHRAAAWTAENFGRLKAADPVMPMEIVDRVADNWRPLLAIADAAGGHWPVTARRAAVLLSSDPEDSGSPGEMLFRDIRAAYGGGQTDRVESAAVVAVLAALEHRPWGDRHSGLHLTVNKLAAMLKPFDIRPKVLRFGSQRLARGYLLAQFDDAFRRYAPD